MNAKAILAPFGSYRVWLAAGVALLSSWIATPLALLAARLSTSGLAQVFDLSGAAGSVVQSILTAVAVAAAVEGSKAASLVWPLQRQWNSWTSVGVAFGILQAGNGLVSWAMDNVQFGSRIAPFSPMLLVLTAKLLIIHWALGRLAAGTARPPGGPWLALLLATVASALINLLPLQPIVFLVRLPEAAFDAAPWLQLALPVMFALAVWRWVPGPAAHSANGPARRIAVTLFGLMVFLCLIVAVVAAIFGPGRNDPVPVLVIVAGAMFVCWMLYQQVLRAWMRQP